MKEEIRKRKFIYFLIFLNFNFLFLKKGMGGQLTKFFSKANAQIIETGCSIYYVDNVNGNDDYDGLSSVYENDHGPWKTIAKVNSSKFLPGDKILFKKNCVWRETLSISSSGVEGSPIIFSSYGEGERPQIILSRLISNWSLYQGNIYVAKLDFTPIQVIMNDKQLILARHPNEGYLYIDEGSAARVSYLIDYDLNLPKEDIIGAEIHLKEKRWMLVKRKVIDYENHKISLDGENKYENLEKNFGYFLVNKKWMLDSPGEWFYDENTKELFVWLANSDNPLNYTIEASSLDYGINFLDKVNNVNIEGLEVKNASKAGINILSGNSIILDNFHISGSGLYGINVSPPNKVNSYGDNILISNNEIKDSFLNGIKLSSLAKNCRIENNKVINTGIKMPLRVGVWGYTGGNQLGIFIQGENSLISGNQVLNSGYSAMFIGGSGQRVENNYIDKCCLLFDDGGGIYMGGKDHQIRQNIVKNCIGTSEGTPAFFDSKRTAAHGIYPDDFTNNILIEDNTVINTDYGILLHNTYNDNVKNNTFYATRGAAIYTSENGAVSPGYIHNNIIENNILYNFSSQNAAMMESSRNFAAYKNNFYAHPYFPYSVYTYKDGVKKYYSLSEWQEKSFDSNSRDLNEIYKIEPYSPVPVSDTDLVLNNSFNSDILNWRKYPTTPDVNMNWSENSPLNGGCLEMYGTNNLSSKPILISNSFNLEKEKKYFFKFSILGKKSDTVRAGVIKGSDPYNSLGLYETIYIGKDKKEFKFTFTATETVSNAQVRFASGEKDTFYWVDDIYLKQANVSYNDISDDSMILVNEENTPQTFNLNTNYLDLNNNVVSGSITLEPFKSKIFLSAFCNNDFTCNNRETSKNCPHDCQYDKSKSLILNSIGDKTVKAGISLDFSISASDPEGYDLIFSASNLPQGAKLSDNRNGAANFSWTPNLGQAGKYKVEFKVNDGKGREASESININVEEEKTNNNGTGGGNVTNMNEPEVRDIVPPGEPKGFNAAVTGREINLSWQNPLDKDFKKVIVIKNNNKVPLNKEDGIIVFEGNKEAYEDRNLEYDKPYYYGIMAYDNDNNSSKMISTSAKTEKDKQLEVKTAEQPISNNSCQFVTRVFDLFGFSSEAAECISRQEAEGIFNHNKYVPLDEKEKKLYANIVGQSKERLEDKIRYGIASFIHNGTESTKRLGGGERAGVINSYSSGYNRMPTTSRAWQDIIKIANGRWPSESNLKKEANAKQEIFKKIYKREFNPISINDNTAIKIMVYGLRPVNRSMKAETQAMNIFKNIYRHPLKTAEEWDILRAIAYSGAKR